VKTISGSSRLPALFDLVAFLVPGVCAMLVPQMASAQSFTVEQVMSSPFPDDLTAAARVPRVAWVFDARGVRNAWIADAPGFWVDEQPMPDLFRILQSRTKVRQLLFHDPESYMAKLVIQDNPDDDRIMTGYQNMTVLARLVWERPYDPKLAGRLHRIQCPTLLVWGANDKLVPPAYAEGYRQGIPGAELKLIPKPIRIADALPGAAK